MLEGGKPLQSGRLHPALRWAVTARVAFMLMQNAHSTPVAAIQCENAPTCLGSKSNFTNPSR